MAQSIAMEMFRGDSKRITVNFSPDAETLISGGEVWYTMKNKNTDEDADAVFQTSVPIVIDGNGKGTAEIIILPAESALFEIKSFYYDIQVVGADPTILVKTLVDGKMKIKLDITKSTA